MITSISAQHKAYIKAIRTLASALKMSSEMPSLLMEMYSVGGYEYLSLEQARDLYSWIQQEHGRLGSSKPESGSSDATLRTLRSGVLKLLTGSSRANYDQRGLGLPNDWDILNPFIVRHGGKYLPQMDEQELWQFRRKLFAIRDTGWSYTVQPCMTEVVPLVAEPAEDAQWCGVTEHVMAISHNPHRPCS